MSVRSATFHLDKRNAKLLGVCSGIADYMDIDATWVRLATILGTIFGSGVLIVVYLVLAMIARAQPV